MSEPDPAALLRELLAEWENAVNTRVNEAMGTDEFSRNINEAIAVSLGAQRSLGDLLERYLRLMNLPSRAEVAGFDARLRSMEDKLDRILERLDADATGPLRPPRTRRPPGPTLS